MRELRFLRYFREYNRFITLLLLSVVVPVINSCEDDPHETNWFDNENISICTYLDINRQEYSTFYRLLAESGHLNTLCAYNPYGTGYTLFLPTDSAFNQYLVEQEKYYDFETLLRDTGFIDTLAQYHILNNKVHTDRFPYGALTDSTLTGERLTVGFYTSGDNALFKINNTAPILQPNLGMVNGYIHVIAGVLRHAEVSGYEWLQQQEQYSILADAMELCKINNRLWFDKYTILAEPDSVYHRYGIHSAEDLADLIATPGMPYNDRDNSFYQFTAYHILDRDIYLNDLREGIDRYRTLGTERVRIDFGFDIRINPGIDSYGTTLSEYGDTVVIDYIQLIWEACNIMTTTGPVHTVAEVLVAEPFPLAD